MNPLLITFFCTITLFLICVAKLVWYNNGRVVKMCDRLLFLGSGVLLSFVLASVLRYNWHKAAPYIQDLVDTPQIAESSDIRKV